LGWSMDLLGCKPVSERLFCFLLNWTVLTCAKINRKMGRSGQEGLESGRRRAGSRCRCRCRGGEWTAALALVELHRLVRPALAAARCNEAPLGKPALGGQSGEVAEAES
jgi:hypothetical protein